VDEQPGGTCMYHEQYQKMLLADHDLTTKAEIKISNLCKKVAEHKTECTESIKACKDGMEKKVDELKKGIDTGVRRLIYAVITAVIIQIILAVPWGVFAK
jgi:hypothetical protein